MSHDNGIISQEKSDRDQLILIIFCVYESPFLFDKIDFTN